MEVVSIFRDEGVADECKIGYNGGSGRNGWPFRFQKAQSHSPRPIKLVAAWDLQSSAAMKAAESDAKKALEKWRRKVCHGTEWFDLPPDEMIAQLKKLCRLPAPFLLNEDPKTELYDGLPYDDWRERSDKYKGQVWKRYLWVHQEKIKIPETGKKESRLKVIHSPCYDTAFRYAFTYNPWPVYLVGAYGHPDNCSGSGIDLSHGNRAVQAVWEEVIAAPIFSGNPMSYQVGWLKYGVTRAELDRYVQALGLMPVDLETPKPSCARPRDSQVAPIAHGAIPPQKRVAVWE